MNILSRETMRFFSRGNAVSLEDLERQFPNATAEECRRFHKACKRDAAEKIGAYLEWREKHNLDSLEESTDDSGSDDSAPPQKTPDLNPVAKDTKNGMRRCKRRCLLVKPSVFWTEQDSPRNLQRQIPHATVETKRKLNWKVLLWISGNAIIITMTIPYLNVARRRHPNLLMFSSAVIFLSTRKLVCHYVIWRVIE